MPWGQYTPPIKALIRPESGYTPIGKGAKGALLKNSGTAQKRSDTLYNEGQQNYGDLYGKLKHESENPEGYNPQQLAYMRTASEQSVGGGAAATTGQANLETARTRNSGGFQGAVGTSNRNAQKDLSQKSLEIESNQANLQQAQKQQALQQLMSLYNTTGAQAGGYLDSSTKALDAENNAPNFWQQYILQAQKNAQTAASAGAGG